MKERPRLIQERVNCINALGKQVRTNDFRCRNNEMGRRNVREGGEELCNMHSLTKTVCLLDTRLESTAGLAPINPDANDVPPPHPLELGCNLSIPHCLLSGGGRRFRTGGRKATSCVVGGDDEISGGFWYERAHLEIAVGGSEIRLCDESRAIRQNCFSIQSFNIMHVKNQYPGTGF
jgi:hypothetical protein